MSETTLRQWAMLRCIPRAPKKTSNASIREALADQGYDVSLRTIQRDLRKLSAVFPISSDDHKPLGWSWHGLSSFDLPGMDVHTAIAFQLASRYLEPLLPRTTHSYLDPHFVRAREVLERLSSNGLAGWPSRIRTIPSGFALRPPRVDQDVLETIHAALVEQQVIAVRYRKRGQRNTKAYEVHPLGLVYRDAVAYLVCTLWSYSDVVQLAVHRMTRASLSGRRAQPVDGFDLEAYCASGAFDFLLHDEPITVTVLVHPTAAPRFVETPVSAHQTTVAEDDGRLKVTFSVPDSSLLHAWLRSFGAFVEVLAPTSLRQEMAATAQAAAALYGSE